ncbi:hypothetical protein [Methylorubrum sp. Q1]|uniref:hypothetical protein n=1 Tax=Methylorubrum sp. Q1 TaxID=2562453 RepID=UPI001FE0E2D7|nr:hypothetical protein [Methylorubrum sp. Q1]
MSRFGTKHGGIPLAPGSGAVSSEPSMFPKLVGSAALLAAGSVLLHSWDAPRWAITALCVIGTVVAVLSLAPILGQPIAPAAVMPAPERLKGPAPVFEGIWDPIERRQVLSEADRTDL